MTILNLCTPDGLLAAAEFMRQNAPIVRTNEKGRRIGESHPRAKLRDEEIDTLHQLVEELIADGKKRTEAYRIAAEKFEVSVQHVKNIRSAQKRAQSVAGFKRAVPGVAAVWRRAARRGEDYVPSPADLEILRRFFVSCPTEPAVLLLSAAVEALTAHAHARLAALQWP